MRRLIQPVIRGLHRVGAYKPLPDQLGVYFHYLPPSDYPAFREAIAWIREQGYRFTNPEEFCLGSGRRAFISIDDNYLATHDALPLFEETECPITLYVNSDFLTDRSTEAERKVYLERLGFDGPADMLSADQLRDIQSAGHTIAAHTRSHRIMADLPLHEAKEDILRGKEDLEDALGSPVLDFSYPYGMRRHFSEPLREYCKTIGFRTVANAIPGMQHAGQDPYAIQRSVWRLDRDLDFNITNLRIDGSWFEGVTGRSAVG